MKILVTGSKGFIGRNLIAELRNRGFAAEDILGFDVDTDRALLDDFCAESGFVFHLAGVNRPDDPAEFMTGNFGFTSTLLAALVRNGNKCPVMLSSSVQAAMDNPYGLSKRAGEELLQDYGRVNGVPVYVYRFPNVFGKWSRPNYNSAVATFCYNIARGLPIKVNDSDVVLKLVYIDDVVEELMGLVSRDGGNLQAGSGSGQADATDENGSREVPVVYEKRLGDIVELLYSFKAAREWPDLSVPDMSDPFVRKLYATYTSFLPEDGFSYPLRMNIDSRGSFTEVLKTHDRGQISVNISHPGIVKGNHWHHTKTEKFLVVSGRGVVRFRRIGDDGKLAVTEYFVSGDKLEVIDIPAGFTHNIENLGDTDMVTLMWASEPFDPEVPDTFYEVV